MPKDMVDPEKLSELHGSVVNRGISQRFFYGVGSFIEHTLGKPPKSDDEIAAMEPEDVRHTGRVTTAIAALSLAAAAVIVPRLIPDEELPFVPKPEKVCEFSGTTVVTRKPGQSDPQLGVIYVKGVNYSHGTDEMSQWVPAHNQGLQGWPGEQVTIPAAYDCHTK